MISDPEQKIGRPRQLFIGSPRRDAANRPAQVGCRAGTRQTGASPRTRLSSVRSSQFREIRPGDVKLPDKD